MSDILSMEPAARLVHTGVIGILRLDHPKYAPEMVAALVDGGVDVIELTMTTPGALETINELIGDFGDRALIGAGSVLDDVTARLAILAGADFIVTPVFRRDTLTMCRRYGVPSICGAYTPTEALDAHEAGANFIKVFPAETLGPEYIRSVLAPMPQLNMIPMGGITPSNVKSYIHAGAVSVAASSALFPSEALRQKDWEAISEAARALVHAVADARKE
jgi:2-dehydro-3-deoxyphosphogluconate aldolase/(4S)-4-hydroxy-2-oxoglutarate aldolase